MFSQKNITLDEVALNHDFINKNNNIKYLKWQDEISYTYVKDNKLIQQSTEISVNNEIFSLSLMNKLFIDNGLDSLFSFPNYDWISATEFVVKARNYFIYLNITDKSYLKKIELPENAESIIPSNDYKYFAFTFENNLYLKEEGIQVVNIEENNDENIVAGQVYKSKLLGETAVFWSPDNSKIAYFLRNDKSIAFKYINNINNSYPQRIKYPLANEPIPEVLLYVYDLKKRTKTLIDKDSNDSYYSNIVWSSDSKNLIVNTISRNFKNSYFKLIDPQNGRLKKILYKESSNTFVNSKSNVVFLRNKNKIIIQANKSGYKHLLLLDFEANAMTITQGKWDVESIEGVSDDNKFVFFKSNKDNPIELGLFKAEIKENAEIINLTKTSGTHNVKLNKNSTYFIDDYSNIRIFKTININSTKNGEIVRSINSQISPLKFYNQCDVSIFKVKTSDEDNEIYCRIIRPNDFTPNKKYPVIFVFKKSISDQTITNSFIAGASLFEYYLAQHQYIVVSIDPRGSENRGESFETAVYNNLGDVESQDVFSSINYLKKLQYVDSNKIGALASDYGAYLALKIALEKNSTFKAVSLLSPITDFSFCDKFFSEKYIDPNNDSTSFFSKSKQLKSKLLIIHGALDRDVLILNSTRIFEEFIKSGKNVDFITYPNYDNSLGFKKSVLQKISDFFDERLK